MLNEIPIWLHYLRYAIPTGCLLLLFMMIRPIVRTYKIMRATAEISKNKSIRALAGSAVDVSVIIPTYNEGGWLSKTAESILRAKTDLRYEILVVDDGCTDGSVQAVATKDKIRVVPTGGKELGCVLARNIGARAASGRYLCFLDSHVLVHDHWLDYLRETSDAYLDGALVSGNLPDVEHYPLSEELDKNQFGYTISNCLLVPGWHYYGRSYAAKPYLEPLTPGGLMFSHKRHFAHLGGFNPLLRKWGAVDTQISLQNYCLGGENVVDPRVVVYHYYKNTPGKQRTFTVTREQHTFNRLHVAFTYFPHEYYVKVREALLKIRAPSRAIAEIESTEHRRFVTKLQSLFVRRFEDWIAQFAIELSKFQQDFESVVGPETATDVPKNESSLAGG
jgi:glycosyltransferase involved in cell wall biosynthesis